MKSLASKIVIVALVLFSFTSCVKDVTSPQTVAPVTDPQSLADLSTSENFNWSTAQKLSIDIKGLSTDGTQQLLQVVDPEGNVIFQKLQKDNENFNTKIEIPAHIEFVNVVFGSASQLYDCTGGTISVIIK